MVCSSIAVSWSASRWAAPSSSPYTSICCWFQAPLPTRTGRLSRQPARCGRSRSVRSCSPPTPNMICSGWSGPMRRGRRGGHEGEEVVGLVRAGGDPQRLHGEAGVAHPGVAVVPVALAADALGQRGGRRGDDRAAGLEGQPLQHPAAVVDQVAPRAVVGLVQLGPGPPGGDGAVQPSASSSCDQTRAGFCSSVERCSAKCTVSPAGQRMPAGPTPVGEVERDRGRTAPATRRRRGRSRRRRPSDSSGRSSPYSGRGA